MDSDDSEGNDGSSNNPNHKMSKGQMQRSQMSGDNNYDRVIRKRKRKSGD